MRAWGPAMNDMQLEITAAASPKKSTIRPPLAQFLGDCLTTYAQNGDGAVANYIPELSKANPAHFGISLATIDGHVYEAGDSAVPFTIQSISKPFVFALALEQLGPERVEATIGVEPSGEPFNSIHLNNDNRPFNAMVNAGAIACSGLIYSRSGGGCVRAHPRGAQPFCRPQPRCRRSRVRIRARDRRPQSRHRLSVAQLFRHRGRRRRSARRLFPPMLDPGDRTRSGGDGGDARQPRHQSDHRRAGRDALRGRAHACR